MKEKLSFENTVYINFTPNLEIKIVDDKIEVTRIPRRYDNVSEFTVEIDPKTISKVQHFSLFKFRFYVFAYSIESVDDLVLVDSSNNVIVAFEGLPQFKSEHIVDLLKKLKSLNLNIEFDEPSKNAIRQERTRPFINNTFKTIFHTMRFWILGLLIASLLIFGPIFIK